MNTERDTHFQHAAHSLTSKIDLYVSEWSWLNTEANSGKSDIPPLETLLARFAYDVAIHAICEYDDTSREFAIEMLDHVSDFATWSDEPVGH